jgi:hypothetical protein
MDFHAARIASGRLLVGTDGGLFWTNHPFVDAACSAEWSRPNGALANQLVASIASGDPADGHGDVLFAGLQDNGTLIWNRDGVWDYVASGDGRGTAVAFGASGSIYWTASDNTTLFCQPTAHEHESILPCHRRGWTGQPALDHPAAEGLNHYIATPAPADPEGAVLFATDHSVFRVDAALSSRAIARSLPRAIEGVAASPSTRGLYAISFADGVCAVTSDGDAAEPHWDMSAQVGSACASGGAVAFPPALRPGEKAGDVYVYAHGDRDSPVLFMTRDRGKTFAPLHGEGSSALPNLRVFTIAYDPTDTSANTIYVGNSNGLWRTTDGGSTWARFGEGLPQVPVTSLFVSKRGDLLRLGTWGRGVWQLRRF